MTLYGDRSGNLAKTYKVIGTLYIIQNMNQEAKEYLLKAQSIFEQRGLQKMLKEVKKLLLRINQQKMPHQLFQHSTHSQTWTQPLQEDSIKWVIC